MIFNFKLLNGMTTIIVMVPDCIVSPTLKNHRGHGEAKLYVGNKEECRDILCQKPILITYSDSYLEFIKTSQHESHIRTHIEKLKDVKINLIPRVKQDLRRMYVGPSNPRDKDWTFFRETLLSYQSCIYFEEKEDHILATVRPSSEFKSDKTIGYSKAAIDWLTYLEETNNIKIQHALNGGEFSIKTSKGYRWQVDGFCKETKTVYEFQGDYWHGNPSIYNENDCFHGVPYSKKWEKDQRKKQAFEEAGYTFLSIWESDWFKIKKELKNRENV
jgi:G:T-mismatch repair DNA endonuclease (very short patch repair protein)